MAENKYIIQYAKSGRASCKDKKCGEGIANKQLRIGKIYANHLREGETKTDWFHAKCVFSALSRARSGTKKIDSTDDLIDFDSIEADDQALVKDLIAAGYSKAAATKRKAPKKKKKDDDDEDDDAKKKTKKNRPRKKPTPTTTKELVQVQMRMRLRRRPQRRKRPHPRNRRRRLSLMMRVPMPMPMLMAATRTPPQKRNKRNLPQRQNQNQNHRINPNPNPNPNPKTAPSSKNTSRWTQSFGKYPSTTTKSLFATAARTLMAK